MNEQSTSPRELTALRVIWTYRRKILIISFAVGIAVGLVSLLFSNKYAAISALLVKQPELPVEGEAPPLNVETLQTLVEADSTREELYSTLNKENKLPAGMSFRDFQRLLGTEILRQRDRDKSPLPMIQLVVTTSDAELSSLIANHWANIVLRKTRDIHISGAEELGQFIGNLYRQAETSLAAAEKNYTSALIESNLESEKSRLILLRESRSRILTNLLVLNEKITQKEALLQEHSRRLGVIQKDGIWLGELYSRLTQGRETNSTEESTNQDDASNLQKLVLNLRRNENLLAQFEEKSNLQFKEMQLKNKDKQLEQISREIVTTQNRLALLSSQFEELKKNLAGLNSKILLRKAISDEAAWLAVLGDNFPSSDLPVMVSEEINTIHQNLTEDMLGKAAEIKGLEGKVAYYESRQEGLRLEVSRLANEISSLRSQRTAFEEAITRDRQMFQHLDNQYKDLRQKQSDLAAEVRELKASRESRQGELAKIEKEIQALENSIFNWEDTLAALDREVESRIQIRDSLSARAGEVEMLNISLQDVSRSGIALLYRAEANPIKVGPQRARIVAAAILAAFLLSSGIISIQHLVRES